MASRTWMYTLNNYFTFDSTAEDGLEGGVPIFKDVPYFRYHICQEEMGELGTPHIQGYLELKRGVRLAAVKKLLPTAHWEIRKGTAAQAIAYCSKEETRIAGPYIEGEASAGQGSREDIKGAVKSIRDGASMLKVLDTHPEVFVKYQRGLVAVRLLLDKPRDASRPKEVFYFYGPPGVGKSRLAAEMAPTAFRKPPNTKWWCGYDGELDVIFDDLTSGWFTWASLMQVLDRYATQVETKGGSRQLVADRIFITSNKRPWELYKVGEDGKSKHPVGAFLRRITHYYEFAEDGSWTDHGCLDPATNWNLPSLLN